MPRSCIPGLLAGIIGLGGATQAADGQTCKPVLAFKEVQFSAMQPPTLERRWTAVVSVDASRCATNSRGYFEIGFLRQQENAPEAEFQERFIWLSPSVTVSVDFAASEAPETYWFNNIAPCPCRQ